MKVFSGLLILVLFATSCTTYQATVTKHDELNYSAIRVYPEWTYKKPKGKKWIAPLIGLSIGGAYGYQTEFTYDGQTFREAENAAIWGGVGLLAGAMVNGILFPKYAARRKQTFELSQSDKWVKSFNSTTGINYVISQKELNNTLVLVPEEKIRELRQQAQVLRNDLNQATPTIGFDELQSWKGNLQREYSVLPSSEISDLSLLISTNETKVANIDLLAKAQQLQSLKSDLNSVNVLNAFSGTNALLYAKADALTQRRANDIIFTRITDIFNQILPEEKNKLASIESGKEGIGPINTFYQLFTQKYGNLLAYEEVKELKMLVEAKKSSMLTAIAREIRLEIDNAQSVNQLETINSTYLSHVDTGNSLIASLNERIVARKQEIIEEEKRRELAKQRAEQERRDQIRKEEEAKRRVISQNNAVVDRLRRDLRIEFESNFPTFEELQAILQAYIKLINDDGEYFVSDGEYFVNLVERKGFMRRGMNNISYAVETFENSRGFTLRAAAYGAKNAAKFTNVSLEIPNPSKEMIRMYKLELVSNYRNTFRSGMNPYEDAEAGDLYVDSGKTVYEYEIDKDGELVIEVRKNTDAIWPIMAERISTNTIKVDSFSNFTDISVREGQLVEIEASGSIKLGVFSVDCYPEGINGFRYNNVDQRFNHGCLIGKIGNDGEWFYIGRNKTFTAPASGVLHLRINDDVEIDNSGYFTVSYSVE
ncbi:hypothetical protein [Cyclobacterium plantarum]|uniref:Uncharacterized protein n=1 Tax=Cyclobacterium plantarum TaxID=2716263 RepID=A0ABX0H8A9_9BACT|nr:hypothetical protein [Cyclobacterium plantarum]NHE56657.1 hypothetical protein [Cyclobacterium plantarum]